MDAKTIGLILLAWIQLVILQTFIHHYMIKELHSKPIYLQWFIIRGMVAIFHGSLFYYLNKWEWGIIVSFQLVSHFVIFNPLLSKLLKHEFFYLGKESGWFDKWFSKDLNSYRAFYFSNCAMLLVITAIIYDIWM